MADMQYDADVTIGEEIACLLAAGWTWDGDKLVHPRDRLVWTMYKRVDSGGLGSRIGQFEAEVKQAVREARLKAQQA